jgi:hypothetical protein
MTDKEFLEARVSYDNSGDPYTLDVMDGNKRVAHVKMDGSTAVVTSMFTYAGDDCVYGYTCVAVVEYLELLPFVQAAKFGEVDA